MTTFRQGPQRGRGEIGGSQKDDAHLDSSDVKGSRTSSLDRARKKSRPLDEEPFSATGSGRDDRAQGSGTRVMEGFGSLLRLLAVFPAHAIGALLRAVTSGAGEKNRARKLTTDEIGAHTCSNFYQGGQFPCLGAFQNRIPRANGVDDSKRFLSIALNRPILDVFGRQSLIRVTSPGVKRAASVLFRTAECCADLPSAASSVFAPRPWRHRAVTPRGRWS